MELSFVVAMSENRVIGVNNGLPWHLPNDLKHFKDLTIGKNILMGRKTFQSLKKPLPHRNNFVLTKDPAFFNAHVRAFHSKEEVLKELDEVMVIGGEEVYRLFLPECRKIYLTLVHANVSGDTYFPELHGFNETSRQFHDLDDRHQFKYSFIELLRA